MAPLINDTIMMVVVDDDEMSMSSSTSDFSVSSSSSLSSILKTTTTTKPSTTVTAPLHTRKSVSFGSSSTSTTTTTHDVLSRLDYTHDELSATWFDRMELKQFKTNARSEAKLIDRGLLKLDHDDDANNSSSSCTRGLECRTVHGSRTKRQRRLNAAAAVFMEIDHQEEMGFMDEDAIADTYYNYSQPCLVAAQMMALRDHRAAMECWEENNNNNQNGVNIDILCSTSSSSSSSTVETTTATAEKIIDQSLFATATTTPTVATTALSQGVVGLACSAAVA